MSRSHYHRTRSHYERGTPQGRGPKAGQKRWEQSPADMDVVIISRIRHRSGTADKYGAWHRPAAMLQVNKCAALRLSSAAPRRAIIWLPEGEERRGDRSDDRFVSLTFPSPPPMSLKKQHYHHRDNYHHHLQRVSDSIRTRRPRSVRGLSLSQMPCKTAAQPQAGAAVPAEKNAEWAGCVP